VTVLSDWSLRALPHLVTPTQSRSIQPCSIDLHLGPSLLRLPYGQTLDPDVDQAGIWVDAPLRDDGRWLIGARELFLGATLERVTVPNDMMAALHGISSLGRYGLLIHVTAGLVDPGWIEAPLTLEIVSLGGPIYLKPGMRVAQLTFHWLDGAAEKPYGGRYVDDQTATPSRSFLDRESMS
jgi:dCTP deaminase